MNTTQHNKTKQKIRAWLGKQQALDNNINLKIKRGLYTSEKKIHKYLRCFVLLLFICNKNNKNIHKIRRKRKKVDTFLK